MLFSRYIVRVVDMILEQGCLSYLVSQRLGTTVTSVYQPQLLRYQSKHTGVDSVTYRFLTFCW